MVKIIADKCIIVQKWIILDIRIRSAYQNGGIKIKKLLDNRSINVLL